jgi:hypothetical protein
MKLPSLFQTIVAAAVLTNVGLVLSPLFESFWPYPHGLGLRLLLCLLISAYAGYLLGFSAQRKGWGTYVLVSVGLFVASYHVSLPWMVIAGSIIVWVTRQLVARRAALPALADLGLAALAVCGFFWALSSSFWLAVWSFFLIQAGAALIPKSFRRTQPCCWADDSNAPAGSDRFGNAFKAADTALRQMLSQ